MKQIESELEVANTELRRLKSDYARVRAALEEATRDYLGSDYASARKIGRKWRHVLDSTAAAGTHTVQA